MAGNISPPRIAFLTGLVLVLFTGGILAGIYLSVDPAVFKEAEEIGFYRFLRDYDFKIRMILEAGAEPARYDLNGLDYDLGRLERRASGVESWLSVLKRRRVLARLDSRFDQAYRQSIRKAAVAFPHSEQIAVIEAAALVSNTAVTGETESELRKILPLLTDSRFASALLSFHILLGDFRNPEKAALLPSGLTPSVFMRSVFPGVPDSETETVITDLAIIQILTGDIREATAAVQLYLSADRMSADLRSADQRSNAPSPEFIRFAAEYFYDFGDLLRSAQLFSGLTDEAALGRQADALWLAGHPDTARNIWSMLAAVEGPLRERGLYNLAVTAITRDEAERLLKTLAGGDAAAFTENENSYRLFGLIRYSRLLEASQAVEILETGKTAAGQGSVKEGISAGALTDLEILGRRAEIREPARTIADTWLLLDTYPGTEELYEWGAWYFDFQRNSTESDILLRNAVRNNFSGQWFGIHEGLKRLRGSDTDGAEEILVSVSEKEINWTVAANLGRIYEARHAPDRALENYQKAADRLMTMGYTDGRGAGGNRRRRENASRIQVGIARTLKTQGRISESRQTLDYALELNPDNLTARLELSRLGE